MAQELNPATVRRIMARVEAEGRRRLEAIIAASALEAERFAKIKAVSGGSHARGTPTPAVRNQTGPALVSGNLRRNIVSSVDRNGLTPRAVVGLAGGAPYGDRLEELGYHFLSLVPDQLRNVIVPEQQARMAAVPWPKYT